MVTEQEYLRSSYEPDCEFKDGVLIERITGTRDHSWFMAAVGSYFFRRRKLWGVQACMAPRNRVQVDKKIREVLDFGVPYVWAIDSEMAGSELHAPSGTTEIKDRGLRIPGTPIEVSLDRLDKE